jgi:hypothetical protein
VQDGEDGADEEIADIIDATAEKFARVTATSKTKSGKTPGDYADDIHALRYEGVDAREKRLAEARGKNRIRRPLKEAFLVGVRAGGVDPADLDNLTFRDDLTNAERQAWREKAMAAGKKIARMYASGDHGRAEVLAEDATESLGHALAAPPRRDPNAHIADDDASGLAEAIIGARQRSGRPAGA